MADDEKTGSLRNSPDAPRPELPAPNAGELDVLGVLWEEEQGTRHALQLKIVHDRVCRRREQFGESPPALTTVSTHLRSLLAKGLVGEQEDDEAQQMRQSREGSIRTRGPVRTRGGLSQPKTRSPRTKYLPAYPPGVVLESTYRGLVEAYPRERRLEALPDFAAALGLDEAHHPMTARLDALVKTAEALGLPVAAIKKLRTFVTTDLDSV